MATSDIPFCVPAKFSTRSLGMLVGRVCIEEEEKKRDKKDRGEGGGESKSVSLIFSKLLI